MSRDVSRRWADAWARIRNEEARARRALNALAERPNPRDTDERKKLVELVLTMETRVGLETAGQTSLTAGGPESMDRLGQSPAAAGPAHPL